MSIFEKVAKKVAKKVIKPAAKKAYGKVVKPGFKKTVGRGASDVPSWRNIRRAANRINPVRGIRKTAEALKAKPRRRNAPR
jgi:hypothetical protein